MKGSARRKLDQQNFMEQVRECRDNYLLSSRKISSGAFSKVYLAYATHERMRRTPSWPPTFEVAITIISTAEAPVEFSQKFLPREISSLNATYKHLNVAGDGLWQAQLYETYHSSQRSYLVPELAARGALLEPINAVSDHRCRPGLEEEAARGLFRQLVSAVAHCHSSGIVHRDLECENIQPDDRGLLKRTDFGFANRSGLKDSLLSTFCGSVAYAAPETLMSKKYNGEQADLWSLGVILYAMVAGKLPFKEHQPHCVLHLMRQGPAFRPSMSLECQDPIRGLLQLRPRARLDLQQVAAHCWMLPATHALFCTVLCSSPVKPAKSQLPAILHPTEPGRDSGRPRPLGQLRRPHHGGTHRGNASSLTPEPPEGVPRRGAGPAQRGLRSVAAASLGVGTSG